AHPSTILPETVLRPDAGIVQARRHRVDGCRLSVVVLQDVTVTAVQHAGLAVAQRGRVLPRVGAAAARLDADQFDGAVGEKGVEHTGGVAAAADTGNNHVGQPADL